MPRGGRGEPDGDSPYKTADGRELKLLKSSASKTGYYNVVEQHPGKFYPKKKLDGVRGSKKMKVFGSGKATAREAAIALAEYTDAPYQLPVARPRILNSERTVQLRRRRRLAKLTAEANELLGIKPMTKAEHAAASREAAAYAEWKAGQPPMLEISAADVAVEDD